jgi:hypothetical protein
VVNVSAAGPPIFCSLAVRDRSIGPASELLQQGRREASEGLAMLDHIPLPLGRLVTHPLGGDHGGVALLHHAQCGP